MAAVQYSSIVEIAQNREFLDSVKKGWSYGSNLNLLSSLPSYSECEEYESTLKSRQEITFDKIFSQPLGFYLMKCFLELNHADDKAVFVSDVKLYKSLTDESARIHISKKIFDKYCTTNFSYLNSSNPQFLRGVSVFENIDDHLDSNTNRSHHNAHHDHHSTVDDLEHQNNETSYEDTDTYIGNKKGTDYMQLQSQSHTMAPHSIIQTQSPQPSQPQAPNIHHAAQQSKNAIDVYGQRIDDCFGEIYNHFSSSLDLFDGILERVLYDLRHNIFPKFIESPLYKLYIQCICYNINYSSSLAVVSFNTLRVLGRGAFGFVNACIKKNTGHIYAMKCINKKRVMATDSVETIMSERNFLSDMTSNFVTGLKYAVQDSNTLYLIIDLMVGGDLKFHLNKEGRFNIERSRFYASEVLLGLQHIHSKGIIYRDIKLENVLLDNHGHCKISDLGLAVRSKSSVRGYAGTPGYTAPEVCLQQSYDACADFFSFGVMVYRFLSGRKPFQLRPSHHASPQHGDKDGAKKDGKDQKGGGPHRTGNELDKNVVEIEPEYPDRYFTPSARSLLKGLMCKNPRNRLCSFVEIKNHPWFAAKIDFGLLESGNLPPPFIPNQDEINADSLRHIGRPPNDDKYKDVEITSSFEKSLSKFPYISNQAQQNEIVDVLQKIHKHYSFESFVHKISKNGGKISMSQLAEVPSTEEIEQYAQNIVTLKKENGVNAFIPQYYLQQQQREKTLQSNSSEEDYDDEEEDDDEEDARREDELHRHGHHDHNGDIGHHYDSNHHKNDGNSRYNKIEKREEEEDEEEERRDELDESSLSHNTDIEEQQEMDEDGQQRQQKVSEANEEEGGEEEEEMKPIKQSNVMMKNGQPTQQQAPHAHSSHATQDRDRDRLEAPKTNTNQCMGCSIL